MNRMNRMKSTKSISKKGLSAKSLRHLKVTSKYRRRLASRNVLAPELRLSGDWLAAAGFAIGGQVEVEVGKNYMTIKTKES